MRKEVIFAIIIGLILGSLLVYGLYQANQNTNITPTENIEPTPTAMATPDQLLTIYSPEDGDIIEKDTVTITGSVSQKAIVIILTEDEEIFLNPQDLTFTQEIELIPGGNLITITAITPSGQRQEQLINLAFIAQKDNKDTDSDE